MRIQNTGKERNLYHWFKRNNVSANDIKEYIKLYPNSSRRVGSLPIDWLKNLQRDEYAHVTEQVDIELHKFAKTVEENRSLFVLSNLHDDITKNFAKLSKNLVNALKQILKRNDIRMEYVDKGGFKYCQKLTVGDYSYALSTFKPDSGYFYSSHGEYTEPQKIFWVYKNSPHGRVAKPFMSRFCVCDEDDGGSYILSKFIDIKDKKRAKMPFNPYRERFYPLANEDNHQHKNEINGICIDCGGIEENPNYKYIPNKEFWKNLLIFLDRMQLSWDKYNYNAEQLLLKQIRNGNDIFNMDLRNLNSPPKNVDEAIRIVRRLRTVHKLKTKLKTQGEFEQYLKFIDTFNGHYTCLLRFIYNGW